MHRFSPFDKSPTRWTESYSTWAGLNVLWNSHAPLTVHSAPQQLNSDRGACTRWQRRWGLFLFSRVTVLLTVHAFYIYPSNLIWMPRVFMSMPCVYCWSTRYNGTSNVMWSTTTNRRLILLRTDSPLSWIMFYFEIVCCSESANINRGKQNRDHLLSRRAVRHTWLVLLCLRLWHENSDQKETYERAKSCKGHAGLKGNVSDWSWSQKQS